MVRGFAPAGLGPRDLTAGTNNDALGGSLYWAATYELQTPLFFAPKDFGMRLRAVRRRRATQRLPRQSVLGRDR